MNIPVILKARVLAGQPIYFIGEMAGPAFEAHVAAVGQLQRELGRSITVVYGPAEDVQACDDVAGGAV